MEKIIDRKKVIVVGAGAAGLYCAASLSPYFDTVILIEKDAEKPTASPRKGVAQGSHLHNILAAGLWLLEQTYAGITRDLIAHGGAPMAIGVDQHIFDTGQWLPSRKLGIDVVALSRPLLDQVLFERTLRYPNIQFLSGQKTESLCIEGGRVVGVNTFAKDGTSERLHADLVVDASGVSAALWKTYLRTSNFQDAVEEVDSNIIYCSAILKKPDQWRVAKENVLIIPEPSQSAGGALIDIEDDQWIVSLHGRHGIAPPTDLADWKAFSQQLPVDAIWKRIQHAEAASPVRMFNKPRSSLRRFDKLPSVPLGYFPVGDLISSVNPIFGQGMTVAWGHVHELVKALNSQASAAAVWGSYIENAMSWSRTAWTRSSAYDRLFIKAATKTEKSLQELDLVKKLAVAKINSVIESENAHRQMVVQAHMLDKIPPAQSQEKPL